jgi:quercetin dioxygenase-like cupin family protein
MPAVDSQMNAMPAVPLSFEQFQAQSLAGGFDEVLVREWAPGQVVPEHRHDFGVSAIVVQGEMWLTCDGPERHLLPGDTFTLYRNEPHAERYGAQGATYWVARRNAGD